MFKLTAKQSRKQKDRASGLQQPVSGFKPHFVLSGILRLQRAMGNQAVERILRSRALNFFGGLPRRASSELGTKYEQEADRAADQALRMKVPSADSPAADLSVRARRRPAGGAPLSSQLKGFFEPRFGYNFDDVRVHTDSAAGKSALSRPARAYTVGNDITFGPGEYRPGTKKGKLLLAHELAHVVQQAQFSPARSGTLAATLSKAPSGRSQPKLIATGDAAGFAALANSVIAVQYEVVMSTAGEVSLRGTDVQGLPTPEAQVLIQVLRRVINDSGTTTIEFIRGTTSTRASDRRVLGGSFPQGKVDLDDEAILGTQESIGLGQGATASALLAHEIEEQYRKQQLGEGFNQAHAAALAVEAQAVGASRTVSQRQISNGIEMTYTYNYPDGRVVVLKFDVVNGNRTNIRRTVTP